METIPISIILGHELIHAQHFLENTNSQINNAENYFFDKRFNSVQKDTNGKIGSQEEYKTVGIGFTKEEAEKQEKFGLRNDDGSIRVTGKFVTQFEKEQDKNNEKRKKLETKIENIQIN